MKKRSIARFGAMLGLCTAAALLAPGVWIPAKAALAQALLEHAWNEERAGGGDAKPWPWADTSPLARLSIPSLDASWIVLSGASGRNLAFAPAHMDGSALPGQRGVSVIAGHRDTHFRSLEMLESGAEIVLEDATGSRFRYIVTGTEVVDATRTRLRLEAGSPVLLLVTCYPFDAVVAGGPLRYVVSATSHAL